MSALQTYKTLKLSENKLEIVNEQVNESSDPQLVMKPLLAGICRSDIKEFLGTRTVRHDFGHEILAEIISRNIKDSRLPGVGDFVVLDPHVEINRSSGFGELIVASGSIENLARAFIKVPISISTERLVFTEPLACAHHSVANLLRFKQRKSLDGLSVGIVGAGMTGVLIGLLCKHYGAAITIINRNEERLNFLKGTSIFSDHELSPINAVKQEFDAVIPTTTFLYPEILEFCEKIVKDSGHVLLYGGTKAGDTFPGVDEMDIDDIRRKQQITKVTTDKKSFMLCGTHGATTEDFRAVINLMENSPHDFTLEKLIGRRINLNEVPGVIVEMTENEILGKTIVNFSNKNI